MLTSCVPNALPTQVAQELWEGACARGGVAGDTAGGGGGPSAVPLQGGAAPLLQRVQRASGGYDGEATAGPAALESGGPTGTTAVRGAADVEALKHLVGLKVGAMQGLITAAFDYRR